MTGSAGLREMVRAPGSCTRLNAAVSDADTMTSLSTAPSTLGLQTDFRELHIDMAMESTPQAEAVDSAPENRARWYDPSELRPRTRAN